MRNHVSVVIYTWRYNDKNAPDDELQSIAGIFGKFSHGLTGNLALPIHGSKHP